MKRIIRPFLLIGLALPLLAACASRSAPATIRVGVLPILDSLPMYVAESQGYFEEEGLTVEFVPVASAPERDQLMQSGGIDAMINELISVILFNKDEPQIVAVRFARAATADSPVFRIIAAGASGIEAPSDLAGVPIGVSEGTVIEYTTDRILQKAGLSNEQIEKLAVPKIPDRLNLLASGQLTAGNLPDPAASLAILNGGINVIDDTSYPEISHSVISFAVPYTEDQPEAVRSFLLALERAVADINSDSATWTEFANEQGLIPEPLQGSFQVPSYPTAAVPSDFQFRDALAWTLEKGLISGEVPYESSVDDGFLP